MNDLQILRDAWPEPDAPSSSAREQVRADLLARATPRSQRHWTVRVVAICGLTTALLAGIAIVPIVGGDHAPSSLPVASAAVLEAAAAAAEDEPFTPPRDDQWIYTRDKFGVVVPEFRQEKWRRADGGGFAFYDEAGRLHVELLRPRGGRSRPVPLGLLAGYRQLAALPTDPEALLRWAYDRTANIKGGGSNEHAEVYVIFEGMISGNVLPPHLEAAIFRALKHVPGVTVKTVEVNGKRVFALGQTDDWLHRELLLDAKTYDYVGQIETVTRDTTINPEKAGNATGDIKAGQQTTTVRIVTAIVDHPGQRP
jgi:hypothetical protein